MFGAGQFLVGSGCPVRCGMLGHIPRIYPTGTIYQHTPQVVTSRNISTLPHVPWGSKSLRLRTIHLRGLPRYSSSVSPLFIHHSKLSMTFCPSIWGFVILISVFCKFLFFFFLFKQSTTCTREPGKAGALLCSSLSHI